MHYSVTTMADGSHVVSEEGDALEAVDSADGVLDLIYRRVHHRAFELASLRGWVRLHAAVVDGSGGRTLIVAPSGTGKTTLSCRLLLDGAAVAADESVMIRNGIALPVARRFHLKSDLEAAVPDLGPYTTELPSLGGGSVRAFDPSEANFPWSVTQAQVAHVVLLERGVERSTLTPGSAVAVMPEIVAESFPHQEPTGALLAEIAAVLTRAQCWRLRMHSVNQRCNIGSISARESTDQSSRPKGALDSMSDQHETESTGDDRRAFLKKMAAVGFAVPVVTTFGVGGVQAAYAQTANASGTTTTTTAATTTVAPATTTTTTTTTAPPTTTTTTTTTTPSPSPRRPRTGHGSTTHLARRGSVAASR